MNSKKPEKNQAKISEVISVHEAGRRGGRATLEKHSTDFFKEIGARGGRRTRQLYAHMLSEFGKKGGRPRRPIPRESMGERDQ
jgi:general stress protein YciG